LAAASAFAQSTVTVSGIVNYGLSNDVNGVSFFGGLKGDRNKLNFSVVEDLGGGSNVTATMEFRFNSGTGAAGYGSSANKAGDGTGATQFEQTAIGYNTPMGNVRVGRFTNVLGVADVSPFEDSKYGTNAARAVYGRMSNQIQLSTPSISGLTGTLLAANGDSNKYGPGGTSGAGFIQGLDYSAQQQTGKTKGVRDVTVLAINYVNGPWFVQYADISGLAYEKATRAAVTYDFGVAKAYVHQYNQKDDINVTADATVTNTSATAITAASHSGLAKHKSTEYGLVAPYGKWTGRVGIQTNDKDLDPTLTSNATKAKKVALGAEYNISKRTQLQYQRLSVTNGASSANIALSGAAATGQFGDITGKSYFVGIQHSF
jgi:hypothetical protein